MPRTFLKRGVVVVAAVIAAVSLTYAVRTALNDSADLERRAEEAVMFAKHEDPYVDEQDMTYPPSSLPVFRILVPTESSRTRRILWVCLSLAATFAICGGMVDRWGKHWPPWHQSVFCLMVAGSKPVRAGIALGQFHVIPVALLVWAEVLAHRAVVSGLLVGLALIKPTMAAPYVLVMLVRRRWTSVLMAGAVQATLFAAASWQIGASPLTLTREWLRNARAQTVHGTIDVPSVLGRLWPEATINASVMSFGLFLAAAILLIVLRKKSSLGLLAISLFAAAVMTYHRHYDMVLLLPAVAYFMDRGITSNAPIAKASGVAFGMLLMVPSNARLMGRFENWYDQAFILASYVVFAGLIVLVFRERNDISTEG